MKYRCYNLCLVILLLVASCIVSATPAYAASLTSISDTLSTLTQNVAANHEIYFVTPTGVQASTDTITIDFTDFGMGSVDYTDIDLAVDNDGNCDGAWTDKTLAATPSASIWGAAIASSVLTLTPPNPVAAGEIDPGFCVQIQIGLNAASGNAQFTNPNDTNTHVIEIDGVFGDDGKFALDFVADDSVNITATVDASITFAISDTTVGFGTLDTTDARWATADTNGSGTDVVAHTLAVSTNATDGWAITYNGATLTSGSDTIDVATITNDPDGNPGTEQFAIAAVSDQDNNNIVASYRHSLNNAQFVADTTTTLANEAGPTATETISMYYFANIAAITEAGLYQTDVTYIATATF